MQKYQDSIVNPDGTALAGVTVRVQTYPGGVDATIYSDDGVTTKANPMTTDSLGAFSFYAADGRYQLVISGSGITARTVTDILLDSNSAMAPLASPTFTGTVSLPSTTSIGSVSAAELAYLDGVTSAIQAQLNSKQAAVVAGSWTPILFIDGSALTDLLNASGQYVKIGNLVIANGSFEVDYVAPPFTDSNSSIYLPFAISSGVMFSGVYTGMATALASIAGRAAGLPQQMLLTCTPASPTTAGMRNLKPSDWAVGATFQFCAIYWTP